MQKKCAKPNEVNRMERIITEYRQPGRDGDQIFYRVIVLTHISMNYLE